MRPLQNFELHLNLHAERGSAAASALHVRVLEFEACTFEGFNVVDNASVQIHDGSGVDEYLHSVHVEGLVHHSGRILELHRVREARAPSAYDSYAEACGNGRLLPHDVFYLGNGIGSETDRRGLLGHFGPSHFGHGCCSHSYLLGSKGSYIVSDGIAESGTIIGNPLDFTSNELDDRSGRRVALFHFCKRWIYPPFSLAGGSIIIPLGPFPEADAGM